jgi:hypothetical protein
MDVAHIVTSGAKSRHGGMARSMGREGQSLHASGPVVSTDHLAATGSGETVVPLG